MTSSLLARIQKLAKYSFALAFSLCLLTFSVKCVADTSPKIQHEQHVSVRDPKLMYLPFIKVVIPQEPCGSENNGVRDGVCLPRGKCDILRGARAGDCSMGFGECCRLSVNCTAEISRVDVDEYVAILKTPDPSTAQCTFKIRKKKDVCQVRLDFRTFTSTSANTEGNCDEDQLTISNSVTVPDGFTTCGDLRDQHMYLSFGSSDSIDITPRLISTTSRYEIVVSQIPCFSRRIVPSHCLQYFNRSSDVVRSFDYPRQQQNNQMYVVCVESTEASKFITWRPCSATDGVIGLPGSPGVLKPFFVSNIPSPTDAACDKDWVQINGDLKHCGDTFPATTRSIWKPYLMNVNFDDREIPNFPFGKPPGQVQSAGECASLGLSSRGIWSCEWFTDPSPVNLNGIGGECQCDVNPLLSAANVNITGLFETPDTANSGFCLRYQV